MPQDALPVWLAALEERLLAIWREDRFPHALLITGAEGIGKAQLAEHLSRALVCGADDLALAPCGDCPECRLSAVGNHPDEIHVGPAADSKSGEISVAQVRELIDRETLTPSRAPVKIIRIRPADQMHPSAANALLKTLEEPTGSSLIWLISAHPERLPATIRSRCQGVVVPMPSEDDALAWVSRRCPDEDAGKLLRLAKGAPFAAVAMAGSGQADLRDELLRDLVAVARGERDPVAVAAAWHTREPRLVLRWIIAWMADLLRARAAPDRVSAEVPAELVQGLEPQRAHRFLQRILSAQSAFDVNVNAQLLLESILIELSRVARGG